MALQLNNKHPYRVTWLKDVTRYAFKAGIKIRIGMKIKDEMKG